MADDEEEEGPPRGECEEQDAATVGAVEGSIVREAECTDHKTGYYKLHPLGKHEALQ